MTASQVETQGLVLLEAAASGLPIVAVRATSIPESVHHGKTGLLAPDAKPENLAKAMLQILNDPDLAVTMGRAGRELACSHSLEHTVDAYEELYHCLSKI
jgi:glycosyltransferase involved in cell wall biosynthesis